MNSPPPQTRKVINLSIFVSASCSFSYSRSADADIHNTWRKICHFLMFSREINVFPKQTGCETVKSQLNNEQRRQFLLVRFEKLIARTLKWRNTRYVVHVRIHFYCPQCGIPSSNVYARRGLSKNPFLFTLFLLFIALFSFFISKGYFYFSFFLCLHSIRNIVM